MTVSPPAPPENASPAEPDGADDSTENSLVVTPSPPQTRSVGMPPLGPRMPALRNGVATLRHLAATPGSVSAGAIARQLNVPRSSMYQVLQVLIDEGLVVHIPEEQGYKLAIGVFELGSAYLRHQPLEHLARPLLVKLAAQIDQTTHLGVLHGHETLYLLKEQPPQPTPLVTAVGVRLPAPLTASGRALLAYLPPAQLAAIFSTKDRFIDRTGRGPRSLRELKAVLAEDQARGWSYERGSVTENVSCIAAAARDHNGMPVVSIGVSFLTDRVDDATRDSYARLIVQTADTLGRRFTGRRRQ
ncbi:IclR family transcriptional regulator [Cryobacterium sp.]|jgi:DNA-binding IclR family transcriptional regulator|uniref:IclR family transcriptional regulator n=1 Tax=Cryobacterium sp. TaxID=1926290 RepID=UPI00260F7B0C|nr:IclR family transcriptional regulator [Cryobacterium sp.]MCU1444493.1 transcriptional regulator, IclR family [Cryobacterium sp.]